MKLFYKLLIIVSISTLFIECKQENLDSEVYEVNSNLIKHSEGFSLVEYQNFSILKVKNAYPEAKETYTYVLHKKNAQLPDSLNSYTKIQVPVQKIIVTSTTHIPSIEMLEKENTIAAFPSTHYVSSEKTRALIDNGFIREIGGNQNLNTELILDLNPDVIVGFSVDGDLKTYKNLEKNGQKIIFNADWTEKTPLGKAEWIKFFGALYDKTNEANTIFSIIEKDYNDAALLAKNIKNQPTVLAGSVFEDTWYLPQGDSWAALFVKEANGDYLWKDSKGTGSLALSFETVLDKAKDADFWIGPGQFTSIDEIIKTNPNYKYFKAIQNKNVYSSSTKKGKTGGIIFYELAPNRPDLVLKDIIKILHPEVLPDYELYFFEKLK
ncbi:MAG: ABC transporter substrate-binding protein [Flavobacterium sp.]|jgi:iron complex transport system substrate-binding protein